MKIVFFIFGLFFPLIASQERIAGFKKTDLQELLKLSDVPVPDATSVVISTIKKEWLSVADSSTETRYESRREQFLQVFKKMWLVDEWINQRFGYAHLVFMPFFSILKSNDFVSALTKLKKAYVTYNTCFFFAIDRPLTVKEIVHAKNLGLSDAKVEGQVYEWLLFQQKIEPEMLKRIIVRGALDKRGKYTAPSPEQMITAWSNLVPKPEQGFVLVVAQQPFCYYYHLLFESMLPKTYKVRIIGGAAPPDTSVSLYLQVIAQIVRDWSAYQEHTAQSL